MLRGMWILTFPFPACQRTGELVGTVFLTLENTRQISNEIAVKERRKILIQIGLLIKRERENCQYKSRKPPTVTFVDFQVLLFFLCRYVVGYVPIIKNLLRLFPRWTETYNYSEIGVLYELFEETSLNWHAEKPVFVSLYLLTFTRGVARKQTATKKAQYQWAIAVTFNVITLISIVLSNYR